MVTNFAEMLPQERGALVANAEANRQPYGSKEQQELLKIRNNGLDVAEMIKTDPNNKGTFQQGRLNSRK